MAVAVAVAAPAGETTENVPQHLRVLVVDDDPMILLIMRGYLSNCDHEVETAGSAAEAIELLAAQPFDVIVSDWVMPKMDGIEFAALAKRHHPAVAFILFTGFGKRLMSGAACPKWIDHVMTKPVSLDEIKAAIAKVLVAGQRGVEVGHG